MREDIKRKLNKAIDEGDIALADQLSAELAPIEIPAMPQDFASRIRALSEQNKKGTATIKKRRIRRRPVVLAAALVALLAFATVAYAAGLLFPSIGFNDGTANTVNAALDSKEYKAASEYASYLNQNYKKLETAVYDPVDYPIYADADKVKELSKKYQLTYAARRTDITSLDQVPSAMKANHIPDFLGTSLAGAVANPILFDKETAFIFDDGNFFVSYILPSKDKASGDTPVSISYTPKGSFPWNGFCLAPGEGTDLLHQDQVFTYTTRAGQDFICVPKKATETGSKIIGYSCFADTGDGYVTVSIDRLTSAANEQKYQNLRNAVDEKYGQQSQSKLGIDLEELQDRVVSQWTERAWEKDYKAMEKSCLATTDPEEADRLSAQLEAKYSTATPEEKELYQAWQDSLEHCWDDYDWDSPVGETDLSAILEKLTI